MAMMAALAQTPPGPVGPADERQTVPLKLGIDVEFPDSLFAPVTVVNGKTMRAVVTITNKEAEDAFSVDYIGGAVWQPDFGILIKNLTAFKYGTRIAAGDKRDLEFSFTEDLMPGEMGLHLAAVVAAADGTSYNVLAYNSTVVFTDPEHSFFDPQLLFLYAFLAALFSAIAYFIYTSWIQALLPQSKRTRRSTAAGRRPPAAAPSERSLRSDNKGYIEDWIPAHHLPQARGAQRRAEKAAGGDKSE